MMKVAVSIGSNLGNREVCIRAMERAVGALFCEPVRMSSLMETEPVGVPEPQPWYLNRVISGFYGGSALQLLENCLAIEADLGRRRTRPLEPRTADIDILLFGDLVIQSAELTVPHPEIVNRRFLLEGLRQIDARWVVPGFNRTVSDLNREMSLQVREQQINFPHQFISE